jgi:hypothetical protein
MLAQNFKTAADLGISEIEHDALRKVLGMLERQEISPRQFTMERVIHRCGTPACICGWARHISKGEAFPGIGAAYPAKRTEQLSHLFAMTSDVNVGAYSATCAQAAIALRNYLTHGEPRWDEALAAS